MNVTITCLYAGLLAFVMLVLNLRVVQQRVRARVGLGTGDDPALEQAVRAHANFVENVPLCLILIVLLELRGVNSAVLHGLGSLLVLARIAHAYGLTTSANLSRGRSLGMIGTYLVQVAGALLLIGEFLKSL